MTIKIDAVQTVFIVTVGDQHHATFSGSPSTSKSMYKNNATRYFSNITVPLNTPCMCYAYFASKPMSKLEALAEILTHDNLSLYHDWLKTVVPASMHPAPKPLPFDDAAITARDTSPLGLLTATAIANPVVRDDTLVSDPITPAAKNAKTRVPA